MSQVLANCVSQSAFAKQNQLVQTFGFRLSMNASMCALMFGDRAGKQTGFTPSLSRNDRNDSQDFPLDTAPAAIGLLARLSF